MHKRAIVIGDVRVGQGSAAHLSTPILLAVHAYSLPDLLGGKLHVILSRKEQTPGQGAGLGPGVPRYPQMLLGHIEARMRQSGHYVDYAPLTENRRTDVLR